jgi:ABC-type sulfate transport system permease subunit
MLDAITPAEWAVLGLSLRVALVSVALSLPLAVAAAWALARGHFPGKGLLLSPDTLCSSFSDAKRPSGLSWKTLWASPSRSAGRALHWPPPSWAFP